jgi:short-subunit dehydrogenase
MNAIITGGSRGIGLAIAEQLASAGYNLVLVAKDAERLAAAVTELQQTYDVRAVPCVCDLSHPDAGRTIAQEIHSRQFVPDVLILNAATFLEDGLAARDLRNAPVAALEETMNMNLLSAVRCVQALLDDIRAGTGKRIVIIGSTAAYEAYPGGALYSVSKWALRGYAINLRRELRDMGVGVTFVSPGDTRTDMWAGTPPPPERILAPSDIGRLVRACLELSPQAVVEEIVVRPLLGDVDD